VKQFVSGRLNGMCGVLSEHCLGLKYTDDGIWPLQKTFIQMMTYDRMDMRAALRAWWLFRVNMLLADMEVKISYSTV
jgi:hypothetical protein